MENHEISLVTFIVYLLLISGSIISWAVFGTKMLQFWTYSKRHKAMLTLFERSSFEELLLRPTGQCPLQRLFIDGMKSFTSLDCMSRALQRATAQELRQLESSMGVLACITATAPFVGLFGTIFGIMHAFEGLENIQTIAPGIAEALLTTAIGIGVAIPASISHILLTHRIKALTSDMDCFALDFINRAPHVYT